MLASRSAGTRARHAGTGYMIAATMRFLLTPAGSSGDVHPFLGIGARLAGRGHAVRVLTAEPFAGAAARAGLDFIPTISARQYQEVTEDPDLWHPTRGPKLVFSVARDHLRRLYALLAEVYEPGTVLVGHTLSLPTRLFEDRYRVPAATVHLAPNTLRTVHGQYILQPGQNLARLPRWLQRAFWWLADRFMIDPGLAPALNEFRRELGLGPVERLFRDFIHSPRRVIGLFPEWFGPPRPDWPKQVRLTGFPLFDEAGQHPADPVLEAFLAAGEPPIAFTAGSANRQAAAFFAAAVEAAGRLGRRALLLTAYPEQLPAELPATALHVAYAPFSEVLPRCAALVHHGGIGTSAQGLAAGVPQLVRPMAFDQGDNAAHLERLGVGRWIQVAKFTPRRVAEALETLLGREEVAAACRRWQQALAEPDPVEQTCDLLEEVGERGPLGGSDTPAG